MNIRQISRFFIAAALVVQLPTPLAQTSTPDLGLDAETIKAAPSKVCHPKKPVTCRAESLTAVKAPAAPPVQVAEEQQSGACFGPRYWLCRADALAAPEVAVEVVPAVAKVAPTEMATDDVQSGACFGPRYWLCNAQTLS